VTNKTIFQQWTLSKDPLKNNKKQIKSLNLNFGPQHPAAHGVLRMILQLNGEVIEKIDTHIGLLHRGTEKLIENKKYLLGLPYFDRLDYVSMLVQEHAYCLSIEHLNFSINNNNYNLSVRTLFDELTRILNHLLALSCHALDVGSMSSIFWAFEEREKIMEFYERLSGARMHAAFYKPFEFNNGFLSDTFLNDIVEFSRGCLTTLNEIHNALTYNKIWKQRLIHIGIINKDDVRSYNLTGVMARSVGFKQDLRLNKSITYGSYYNLNFKTFIGWNGDCFDRYLIRLNEMVESLNIINQIILNSFPTKLLNNNILKFLVKEKNLNSFNFLKMSSVLEHFKYWSSGTNLNRGFSFRSVESPKGEFGVSIVGSDSSIPYRCKIRSPSYYNLKLLSKLSKGHYLADLVTLIGTIDIVFGEIDR